MTGLTERRLKVGTRSDIIVHRTDGTWARVTCHYDGYPTRTGAMLFDEYTTQTKAEALVALGNISTLGADIGEKTAFKFAGKAANDKGHLTPEFIAFLAKRDAQCIAYRRDRGDSDAGPVTGKTLDEVWADPKLGASFVYVWADFDGAGPLWHISPPSNQGLLDLGALLSNSLSVRQVATLYANSEQDLKRLLKG